MSKVNLWLLTKMFLMSGHDLNKLPSTSSPKHLSYFRFLIIFTTHILLPVILVNISQIFNSSPSPVLINCIKIAGIYGSGHQSLQYILNCSAGSTLVHLLSPLSVLQSVHFEIELFLLTTFCCY